MEDMRNEAANEATYELTKKGNKWEVERKISEYLIFGDFSFSVWYNDGGDFFIACSILKKSKF